MIPFTYFTYWSHSRHLNHLITEILGQRNTSHVPGLKFWPYLFIKIKTYQQFQNFPTLACAVVLQMFGY